MKAIFPIVSSPRNRCGVAASVMASPPVLMEIVYQLKVTNRSRSHTVKTPVIALAAAESSRSLAVVSTHMLQGRVGRRLLCIEKLFEQANEPTETCE